MRQASTFLCLSPFLSVTPPFSLYPSKCPPATATSGFGNVLEEGGSSKLSRRAQHNEERYFVKRCRRHGVDDRTNGDGWPPREDSADIARGVTRIKSTRDTAHETRTRPLQTLRVSGPSPCVTVCFFCLRGALPLSFSFTLFALETK